MSKEEFPYVGECHFCGNGLLRPYRCAECDEVVAICDECELTWKDLAKVYKKKTTKSSGAFPACPCCETAKAEWYYVTSKEMKSWGLDDYIAGESI